jgi:hypothetical protein
MEITRGLGTSLQDMVQVAQMSEFLVVVHRLVLVQQIIGEFLVVLLEL